MEDLAGRLGITKSAIYHHVPSKEELLAAESSIGPWTQLFAVARRAVQPARPGHHRLEHLVRASISRARRRLAVVTAAVAGPGQHRHRAGRAGPARGSGPDAVTGLVAEAIAEGDVRSDLNPATTARLLFGLVNSLVEWYRPGSGATASDVADAVAVLAFDGLRSRRP